MEHNKLSRTMTAILRHRAAQYHIPIRADGFVLLDDLLRHCSVAAFHPTLEIVQQVVAADEKGRFELRQENGHWYIRATQGHSMKHIAADELLVRIQDPAEIPMCVHGTYSKNIEPILATGLSRMQRTHIHFAPGEKGSGEVVSGMRNSCDIMIYVDHARAMADGIVFYRSANNVILTDGIDGVLPAKYISRIATVRDRRTVWPVEGGGGGVDFSQLGNTGEGEQKSKASQGGGRGRKNAPGQGGANPGSGNSRTGEEKQSADDAALTRWLAELQDPPLEYLAVLDFEATCDRDRNFGPTEVIEFPIVLFHVASRRVEAEFHSYVRPLHHPKLTRFCVELTGIQQQTVDGAPDFEHVWLEVLSWMQRHELIDSQGRALRRFAFATCGDWDLKTMLPKQMRLLQQQLAGGASGAPLYPPCFRCWINVKRVFADVCRLPAQGMDDMLRSLGMELIGRHHSGIDDSRNIARIVDTLIQRGCVFSARLVTSALAFSS